jgi:peptidoglycan pentaglycine glycine transferase (the first glycine)
MMVDWNMFLLQLPNPHILQTVEWSEQKKDIGWKAEPIEISSEDGKPIAGAMILTRTVRPFGIGPGFSVCYVPRGPVLDWNDTDRAEKMLKAVETYCKQKNAIFIKIDPEINLGTGIPGSADEQNNPTGNQLQETLRARGWNFSKEQIQFRNTVLIDLSGSEETWLARMKQKTRYNIRLAQRSGVTVRQVGDDELPALYQMYALTASRDNFIIREESYYLRLWRQFMEAGYALPLVAEVEGEKVAALVMFLFGRKAWYFYGMSTNKQRDKMPNYLLQWEAMKAAKSRGCETYDLWGAPDEFDGGDSMSGVFRFKEGLGGVLHRTIGAWDYPNRKILHIIYQQVLPRILDFTRWLRRGKIRQEAQ